MTLFDVGARTSAIFSEDRRYRYQLTRIWDDSLPLVAFGMLNPSDANEEDNDPTATRCIGFAKGFGYGGLIIGNMFALVSSDPATLTEVDDPIGPENDAYLAGLAESGVDIICAWGASVPAYWRHRPRAVVERWRQQGAKLFHLGLTKDGSPRHPLYLAASTPLTRWDG